MAFLLVCGGRDFTDAEQVAEVLGAHYREGDVILQGGARGADTLAMQWARYHRVPFKTVDADWQAHGNAAGPIRNQKMLEMGPRTLIAFPGGKGTADMVIRARKAGVPVIIVVHPDPNH